MAATAEKLGIPLMGWQRHVCDVGLEVDESGRPVFRDVMIGTPRQSGKSILLMSLAVWRMLSAPGQQVAFAAQNRLSARTALFERWWPRIRRSPLRDLFTLTRQIGSETLRCSNGSTLVLLSSEESAGHGATLDLAIVDECWSLTASTEQSMRPAMVTRPAAQAWLTSTAGNWKSEWWRAKVDGGRVAAQLGTDDVAYFEWSAPDEADPTDEGTWLATMPALGVTVEPSVIRADMATMPIAEFRRAYLNQWPEIAMEGWRVIAKDAWEAARWE